MFQFLSVKVMIIVIQIVVAFLVVLLAVPDIIISVVHADSPLRVIRMILPGCRATIVIR